MSQESVSSLLLEQLHDSPFNPRLTFDEADLQELADSIRSQGVLQPIVARPIVKPGMEHQFEIVFGHRRRRAAELAGYVTVPTIVRPMSDEEAAVAQIHENLKRTDVHPIEEALGYERLMKDHQVSTAELITKTGRSKSYIYARLKLTKLSKEARAACLRGELDAETAVLVARYCRTPKLQARAVDLVTTVDPDTGKKRPVPFRQARVTLRENFCIYIDEAPFDSADPTLRQIVGACTTCSKLAGNDPELALQGDADVCTDRECYQAKCEAHTERVLSTAKKAGAILVRGDEAKALLPQSWTHKPDKHILLNDTAFIAPAVEGEQRRAISFEEALQAMGADAPAHLAIAHPHKTGAVVRALPDAAALQVLVRGFKVDGKDAEVAAQWDGYFELAGSKGGDDDDDDDDDSPPHASSTPRSWTEAQSRVDTLPPEQQAVMRPEAWALVCRAILERVRSTPRSTEELRMMALRELHLAGEFGRVVEDVLGWTAELEESKNEGAVRQAKAQAMGPDELAALLVMVAIETDGFDYETRATGRLALAARYGVDAVAVAQLPPAEKASEAQRDLVDEVEPA